MAADGVSRALAFCTSAYSSYSSCRQYLEDIARARAAACPAAPQVDKIKPYSGHPAFAACFAAATRAARTRCPPGSGTRPTWCSPRTASPRPCRSAAARTAARTRLSWPGSPPPSRSRRAAPGPWRLAYSSRSGPPSQPWLVPDINDCLAELAQAGARRCRGADRVRLRPHGSPVRPGRRGRADRRPAGPAVWPGGHARHQPAVRRDDHRPDPRVPGAAACRAPGARSAARRAPGAGPRRVPAVAAGAGGLLRRRLLRPGPGAPAGLAGEPGAARPGPGRRWPIWPARWPARPGTCWRPGTAG